jgi:hypothetical protein
VANQGLSQFTVYVALHSQQQLLDLLNANLLVNETESVRNALELRYTHSQVFSAREIYLLSSLRSCWHSSLGFPAVYFTLNLFKAYHHVVVLLLHACKLKL